MSDSTGFGRDFVVNQFFVQRNSNAELTPEKFFQDHPAATARNFVADVVIADIRSRIENETVLDLAGYFEQFPELTKRQNAWRILDAAEPWLIQNEGANWKQRWLEKYPDNEASINGQSVVPIHASPPNLDDLAPGVRLLHFEICRLVGRGTYGIVYLASNMKLARDVALKLSPHGGNEGRALARLNHSNIVRVYGQYEAGSKRILEMEYVDGSSLDKWIRLKQQQSDKQIDVHSPATLHNTCDANVFRNWARENSSDRESIKPQQPSLIPKSVRSPVQVAVWITLQLSKGLTHAHQRGILHQDVKPANVLVDAHGKPLLTDFNVAFIDGQSRAEGIGGTINYMSPEHLRAFCASDHDSVESVDLRSDIYSLGLVLLELLGGDKLLGGTASSSPQTLAGDLLSARQKPVPKEVFQLAGVDQTLAAVVEKALQPDASYRYQSASEFATDLSNWLDGLSNTYAKNPSIAERSYRFVRRKKLAVGAFVIFLASALGALFGWLAVENSRLQTCELLLNEVSSSIDEGRGAYAAEKLGATKIQLERLWFSPWFQSDRFEKNVETAGLLSQRVKQFESIRFTSLFGQASLLSVHQDDQQEIQPLVEESLRTYGVMTDSKWQDRPPFSQLSPSQQDQVAENITELMLVSMIHSSKVSRPNDVQWFRVIERLPDQHRKFQIFEQIKNGETPIAAPTTKPLDSFEMYLNGVWATCDNRDKDAMAWYSAALLNQPGNSREKFWLRYRAGLSAQRLGDHDEAIANYNVCLGMKPDFAWLPFNIALIHIEAGEKAKAQKALLRTVYLDPKMSAAYHALAAMHLEEGDFQTAARICEQANSAGASSPELTRLDEIIQSRMNQNFQK